MPHRVAIRANEPVAPVVKAQAELAIAAYPLGLAGQGIEAEIHAADVDDASFWHFSIDHFAAAEPVGHVNPIVEREPRMIGPELGIQFRKTFKPGFIDIRFTIAVRILHVGQSARQRDKDAAFPRL